MTEQLSAARAGTVVLGRRKVHRLGLGTNRMTDTEAGRSVLLRAVELGVDFFDTADVYQATQSERAIGTAFRGRASDMVVATKGGLLRTPEDLVPDGSPSHLRRALEGSLERLGVRCIDLYQLHRVDPKVPVRESVGALKRFQEEGLVRHIGLSNVTVQEIEAARSVAEIVSVQNRYNVLEPTGNDVLEYCERSSIAFIPWTPVGRGKVAGSKALNDLAAKREVTPHQLALAWLLRRSPVMLPIPGTLSLEHLRQNLAAAELELSDPEFAELSSLA